MKFTIYQKQKCVLAQPYELTNNLPYTIERYDPIPLSEITSYFIEETSSGFALVIETDSWYTAWHIVDVYASRKEAENAAKIL
jgi:hypothetical protein